tara:strand:+ start:29 stop:460 length:432 start_codon:yes stop_codon:yes gene_type:complete
MNKQQFKNDLSFGFANELPTLQQINMIFKETYKTKQQFNNFDFRNDKLKIDLELKTRRIYKGQYKTIFFGKNKLLKGRKRKAEGLTNRIIYLFSFTNGLYCWEDTGTDEDFKITMCGNYARGDRAKELVDLDIDKLQLFSDIV